MTVRGSFRKTLYVRPVKSQIADLRFPGTRAARYSGGLRKTATNRKNVPTEGASDKNDAGDTSSVSPMTTSSLVLQAVERRGEASATVRQNVAGKAVHAHHWRAAKEAAKL